MNQRYLREMEYFLDYAQSGTGDSVNTPATVSYTHLPSGEITNLPYLEKIAATKKPVILSTGMSTLSEIEDAVSVLEEGGVEQITLLHCNTEYPTPFEDANLTAMDDLRQQFGLPVGYSDHTTGRCV